MKKCVNFHCNSFVSIKNEHVYLLAQALSQLDGKNSPEQVFIVVSKPENDVYKKLPSAEFIFDCNLDKPDACEGLAVVSTPNVSCLSQNTEPDEITWDDFPFHLLLMVYEII